MTTKAEADRDSFLAVVNEVMDYYGFKNKLSPGAIFGLKKAGFTTPESLAGELILLTEGKKQVRIPYVYLKQAAKNESLKRVAEKRYWQWIKVKDNQNYRNQPEKAGDYIQRIIDKMKTQKEGK